jgi:hypothetical protein
MAKMIERLKRVARKDAESKAHGEGRARRRDSDYYRALGRDIAQASRERAGELAGHAIERRDS